MDEETKQKLLEELRKEYKVELEPLTPLRQGLEKFITDFILKED